MKTFSIQKRTKEFSEQRDFGDLSLMEAHKLWDRDLERRFRLSRIPLLAWLVDYRSVMILFLALLVGVTALHKVDQWTDGHVSRFFDACDEYRIGIGMIEDGNVMGGRERIAALGTDLWADDYLRHSLAEHAGICIQTGNLEDLLEILSGTEYERDISKCLTVGMTMGALRDALDGNYRRAAVCLDYLEGRIDREDAVKAYRDAMEDEYQPYHATYMIPHEKIPFWLQMVYRNEICHLFSAIRAMQTNDLDAYARHMTQTEGLLDAQSRMDADYYRLADRAYEAMQLTRAKDLADRISNESVKIREMIYGKIERSQKMILEEERKERIRRYQQGWENPFGGERKYAKWIRDQYGSLTEREALEKLASRTLFDASAGYILACADEKTLRIYDRTAKEYWETSFSENIVDVAAGRAHYAVLMENGVVWTAGNENGMASQVQNWRDITDIAAGDGFIVGVRPDGTVEKCGNYLQDENMGDWANVVSVAAGDRFAVALTGQGKAVSSHKDKGESDYGNVHCLSITAAGSHTAFVTTSHELKTSHIVNWNVKNVKEAAVNDYGTAAVHEDGKVSLVGPIENLKPEVKRWRDVEKVYLIDETLIAVTGEGRVFTAGEEIPGLEYFYDLLAS